MGKASKRRQSATIDEVLDAFHAPRTSVPILLRADLLAEHASLARRYEAAVSADLRGVGEPTAPALAAELLDLEAEIEASTTTLVFEALPTDDYQKLVGQHRPGPDDEGTVNPVTFPAAVVSACAVDPVMDPVKAGRLLAKLSDGQFAEVFGAAVSLNVDVAIAPKSLLLSAVAAPRGTGSTTASLEESPEASS